MHHHDDPSSSQIILCFVLASHDRDISYVRASQQLFFSSRFVMQWRWVASRPANTTPFKLFAAHMKTNRLCTACTSLLVCLHQAINHWLFPHYEIYIYLYLYTLSLSSISNNEWLIRNMCPWGSMPTSTPCTFFMPILSISPTCAPCTWD